MDLTYFTNLFNVKYNFNNMTSGVCFLDRDLPSFIPRPRGVTDCPSQRHVLQTRIIATLTPRKRQQESNGTQTAVCQTALCLPAVVRAADNIDTLCDISGNT